MAKIYLVSSGDYSDYRIDAVFSTKEKAEELLLRKGHKRIESEHGYVFYGTYSIEEYDLDPDDTGVLPKWVVNIRTDVLSNEVTSNSWSVNYGLLFDSSQPARREPKFTPAYEWIKDVGHRLIGWQVSYLVEAETKELAEKIAADWRREDIALGKLADWEREKGINQQEQS
jgi:hypothetical protein